LTANSCRYREVQLRVAGDLIHHRIRTLSFTEQVSQFYTP